MKTHRQAGVVAAEELCAWRSEVACARNRYYSPNFRWTAWTPCPRTRCRYQDCRYANLQTPMCTKIKKIFQPLLSAINNIIYKIANNTMAMRNLGDRLIALQKNVIHGKEASLAFKHVPPSFLMSVFSLGLILALVGRPGLCESGAGVAAISPSQRRSRAHNSPRIASRSTSWESVKAPSAYVAYFYVKKKIKKILVFKNTDYQLRGIQRPDILFSFIARYHLILNVSPF